MKKNFLQLVLAGLFALSAGTVGAVLLAVALAPPAFAASCVVCQTQDVSCPGSPTCNCLWNSGTSSYYTLCQGGTGPAPEQP